MLIQHQTQGPAYGLAPAHPPLPLICESVSKLPTAERVGTAKDGGENRVRGSLSEPKERFAFFSVERLFQFHLPELLRNAGIPQRGAVPHLDFVLVLKVLGTPSTKQGTFIRAFTKWSLLTGWLSHFETRRLRRKAAGSTNPAASFRATMALGRSHTLSWCDSFHLQRVASQGGCQLSRDAAKRKGVN